MPAPRMWPLLSCRTIGSRRTRCADLRDAIARQPPATSPPALVRLLGGDFSMGEPWISEVLEVGQTLAEYHAPWAVAGGWALDLFLSRATRAHTDIDVAIWRSDQATLRSALPAWSFAVADAGVF